ncbi:MAG: hypothetical protein ACFFAE_15915 [Candidatus Hodarchaeota archaeon]
MVSLDQLPWVLDNAFKTVVTENRKQIADFNQTEIEKSERRLILSKKL